MQTNNLSADVVSDSRAMRIGGEPSPEKNRFCREKSTWLEEEISPIHSDSKVIESEDWTPPIEVKETKFFVGGVPPNMPTGGLQALWETGVRKC